MIKIYLNQFMKGSKKIMYYVYMLRCQDDTIYTGITSDINRRMAEHFSKDKKSAKYIRSHTAKQIEAVWQCENRSAASKLEFYIKRLSRNEKEKLINKNEFNFLCNKINKEDYKIIKLKN
ncbi:MAG: GIY-YIG nuclease family protein [Acutalibacteraceae bacterium]|nr:GIY-YIG nuclease family protein [Acutalibacteraceae bacterium]